MKPRILVVDDSPEIRRILSETLTRQGWDVETCQDGADAYSVFMSNKFEVVLTDFEMPNLDGLRLTKKILEKRATQQIYMLSGTPTAAELFIELGGKKFFDKSDPASAYTKFLDKVRQEIEADMCGCDDCEEEDCFRDCDYEEPCQGCREAREEEKDREFEFAKAQGRI